MSEYTQFFKCHGDQGSIEVRYFCWVSRIHINHSPHRIRGGFCSNLRVRDWISLLQFVGLVFSEEFLACPFFAPKMMTGSEPLMIKINLSRFRLGQVMILTNFGNQSSRMTEEIWTRSLGFWQVICVCGCRGQNLQSIGYTNSTADGTPCLANCIKLHCS